MTIMVALWFIVKNTFNKEALLSEYKNWPACHNEKPVPELYYNLYIFIVDMQSASHMVFNCDAKLLGCQVVWLYCHFICV